MHILLIEDDLDLGQALLQALQLDGFTVQWLRSVAATPPVPDANEIAAVLLDLTLPDGQGMALLRRATLNQSTVIAIEAMIHAAICFDSSRSGTASSTAAPVRRTPTRKSAGCRPASSASTVRRSSSASCASTHVRSSACMHARRMAS